MLLQESTENQRLLLAAMAREWKKWEVQKGNVVTDAG